MCSKLVILGLVGVGGSDVIDYYGMFPHVRNSIMFEHPVETAQGLLWGRFRNTGNVQISARP